MRKYSKEMFQRNVPRKHMLNFFRLIWNISAAFSTTAGLSNFFLFIYPHDTINAINRSRCDSYSYKLYHFDILYKIQSNF